MQTLQKICLCLTIIGAIVWGLIGVFDFNLVDTIFVTGSTFSRIIYSLVGIGGVVMLAINGHEECYCENTDTTFRS